MALNDKEKCFANEYIINKGNAYKAALSAGYAKNTAKVAYQWIEEPKTDSTQKRNLPFKPELKEYISKRVEEMESEKIADAKEVMEYLTSVIRGESLSEIVVIEGTGMGESRARTMMKAPDEKDRLKAAVEMGKILGISTQKIDLDGNVGVTIIDDLGE